jgi:hypothetical protein
MKGPNQWLPLFRPGLKCEFVIRNRGEKGEGDFWDGLPRVADAFLRRINGTVLTRGWYYAAPSGRLQQAIDEKSVRLDSCRRAATVEQWLNFAKQRCSLNGLTLCAIFRREHASKPG